MSFSIIDYATKSERTHVEEIIRSQAGIADYDNVSHSVVEFKAKHNLSMDVYTPKCTNPPVIVNIHGGGLIAGRKEQNRKLAQFCAANGYLTFVPDYRLVPETNIFGQISDVLCALNAVQENVNAYGGDINNMFIVADSAGAFLACMAVAILDDGYMMEPIVSRLDQNATAILKNLNGINIRALGLQSGMYSIYKGKVGLLANYYMEKGWKKSDYARLIKPETYAVMLPPCFINTGKGDFLRKDTLHFAQILHNENLTCEVRDVDDKAAEHAFAALNPNLTFAMDVNQDMLKFFENYMH